jgi:hypothetical protein
VTGRGVTVSPVSDGAEAGRALMGIDRILPRSLGTRSAMRDPAAVESSEHPRLAPLL